MNISFRVDGSTKIGTGHVMRCLTLAEELRKNGHMVYFICRLHEGHLCNKISDKGFIVIKLNQPVIYNNKSNQPKHASWLGLSQKQDVQETIQSLISSKVIFDWIIIDHYAIDKTWEKEIRNHISNIMVIDDLADREHDCDILLDQNYYQNANTRYSNLVPFTCNLLLGPEYAILRDEFIDLRKLPKQKNKQKTILVSYGGSDPTNETLKAMNAIKKIHTTMLKSHIVIGPANTNIDSIKKHCDQNNFILHFNIDYMAKLMHEADFAICAGGSITWERYSLGLSGILTAIAINQIELCENLKKLGIDHYLGVSGMVTEQSIKKKIETFLKIDQINLLSKKSRIFVDGKGKKRVMNTLTAVNNN
ncbi:UDP-2,4-diacetamido-2,4,6-trideoxy-beta-L-altropyranose hydrolase [Oceanobacillus profundus]|uniref:UDP-2,4-diacetamido-2,4, 6-trideoxy-beta-L-altropyranose hydrolase n=1 Tax=Oceanobacillus profundus TaxID=372463 RepID=UPI003627AB26